MSEAAPQDGHAFPLRVYYEDTDAGGIVYYANYLRFAERARTEMLRGLGVESSDLMADDGVALAVRHCAADYMRPARLDDALTVETRVTGVGGATLELAQTVRRGDEDLVRLDLKLGCMGLDGRPKRLPGHLRQLLNEFQDG